MSQDSQVALINTELNRELKDPAVVNALLSTTFKKMTAVTMKQALMEGMIRGFKFKDFLDKNVYAIPYGSGYSLVTSVDYSRKIGMKSGIVGTSAPIYKVKTNEKGEEKIISCEVTVKRKIGDYIGDFTAEVYFDEYYKKGNEYQGKYTPSMWDLKPRTMIAKVAEMHALRKACPESLAQNYIEDEITVEPVRSTIRDAVETPGKLRMGKFRKKGNEETETIESEEGDTQPGDSADGVDIEK